MLFIYLFAFFSSVSPCSFYFQERFVVSCFLAGCLGDIQESASGWGWGCLASYRVLLGSPKTFLSSRGDGCLGAALGGGDPCSPRSPQTGANNLGVRLFRDWREDSVRGQTRKASVFLVPSLRVRAGGGRDCTQGPVWVQDRMSRERVGKAHCVCRAQALTQGTAPDGQGSRTLTSGQITQPQAASPCSSGEQTHKHLLNHLLSASSVLDVVLGAGMAAGSKIASGSSSSQRRER